MPHKPLKYIILLDDDEDESIILRDAFAEMRVDIKIQHAQTFQQLCIILEKSTELPGMLLLDINLPVQTGVECLKTLKSQARFKLLPIVMYSHSAHLGTAEECLKLGATIYVKKSSSFNILKQNLAFIMSQDLTAMLNIGIKERMLLN